MLEHGGRLRAAAARYRIPLADWLDLSTGVSPHGWPVPTLAPEVWQRLPEDDDGLDAAMAAYYRSPQGMAVAGSQAAIQALPGLFPRASIGCLAPLYNEHPHAWRAAGHEVHLLKDDGIEEALARGLRHLLVCNPNNPTGRRHDARTLLAAAARLNAGGGVLIVDEAFIDATPDNSLVPLAGSDAAPNLIVLRSLGKFFGLAGVRVGFVFAASPLLERLRAGFGPWAISGPSREVARLALLDRDWQRQMRERLPAAGQRLATLVAPLGEVGATALFATVRSPHASALHETLARGGILTRLFDQEAMIRFGLPDTEPAWARLEAALTEAMSSPEMHPA
ncbi:threonine-phosphate decarboxylase CobD [Denitromonas iodatirespirans]|uniref:threonine-phosphate decarboxylase n=1 Tax=Denitromonas iodatirespirans TaxID=2795389 RepID=A0A944DCM1_DENI1|nr:threonine-phosphate decarboxylase CobD [Denitromonas iodatirespirans]MBT0961907.1 threonine-phosphate decarboxylase [Denitromonas iodatirespirans]